MSVLNIQNVGKNNYGLFFLNYTGIPCILEDLIINEIVANKRIPILFIDKKYIKKSTAIILDIYYKEVKHFFISDCYNDLFKTISEYKQTHNFENTAVNLPFISQEKCKKNVFKNLGFSEINYFNSCIYYHPKQFQVETIEKNIKIKDEFSDRFFHIARNIKQNEKQEIISYKSGSIVNNLEITAGNRSFDEILKDLKINCKRSHFIDSIIKDNLQIGCLNQDFLSASHLLSRKVYEFLLTIK